MTDKYAGMDELIAYIHQHLYDPLPLAQLAAYAGYSPYHFIRIFKEKTGLSPLYYVSSLRLQKAKDLLLRTNLSIRDIGLEIGQQSLGTFTTRFTSRVGATPSDFRNSTLQADNYLRALQKLHHWHSDQPVQHQHTCIHGTIQTEIPFQGFILLGLFAKPIPEGMPLYGTLVASHQDYCIQDVKPGIYYLMATSVSWDMQALDVLLPYTTLRTRSKEPLIIHSHTTTLHQQVTLHVSRPDDPPILISLPLLMNNFLNRTARLSQR
ncbi:transcriptional regulator [Paenibacillus ferrarius]|uniref:Transcriptional regulator n=1 Tax=Paenibacillus ferrarius TaxID=1469647 RepID=A0A1V4HTE9_9BACL|nr:transcriptional regulator [Paenibacillus ferrarius]